MSFKESVNTEKNSKVSKITMVLAGAFLQLYICVLTLFPFLWEKLSDNMSELVFKIVPFFVLLFATFIYVGITAGVSLLFYGDNKNENVGFKTCFYYFLPRRFLRLIKFKILTVFSKLLCIILSFLPVLFILFATYGFYKTESPYLSVGIMFVCSAVSAVLALRVYFEFNAMLFLSEYIFFEKNDGKVRDAIKQSVKRTKGKTKSIRKSKRSFVLSFLSCVFIIPIPFVFVKYKRSMSLMGYEIMKKEKSH